MTQKRRHKGFTLVEVLVAITIFAIAISTLFASFNTVISTIDPMNTRLDNYEMAQSTMDRIQRDLTALCLTLDPVYTPPAMEGDDTPDLFRFVAEIVSFEGKPFSQLRFASFDHIAFNRDQKNRIGIITYYVEPSEKGHLLLKRSDIESVLHDETKTYDTKNDPVLCENLTVFELIFIDQEGNTQEEWDSDAQNFEFATPHAIRIKLEIGNDKRSDSFATTIILPAQREKNES